MGRTVGFSHFSMGHLGHVWDVPTTPWTLGREGSLGIVMANLDMSAIFILVSLIFYPDLALIVARGEMSYVVHAIHV